MQILQDAYNQEVAGHMFDRYTNSLFCSYVDEDFYPRSQSTCEEVNKSQTFKSNYGFADSCLLDIIYQIAEIYKGLMDKKYYDKLAPPFYNEKSIVTKKAFAK